MMDEELLAYEREAYLARQRRRKRQAARRRAQTRRRRLRAIFILLLTVLVSTILARALTVGEATYTEPAQAAQTAAPQQMAVKLENHVIPATLQPMPTQTPVASQVAEEPLQYIGEFCITHYCACKRCCGKSEDDPWYGITATGTVATEGRTIAVDPDVIPYGSRVAVFYDDGRIAQYVAEDCGGAIDGLEVDVFIADHDRAWALGVKSGSVYIVNEE